MEKTIALIHTTAGTIASLKEKLLVLVPEWTVRNYLDESILPQINAQGEISQACAERFFMLCQSAAMAKPDAMLCACSSVGALVEQFAKEIDIPFLRIDTPMAEEAVGRGGKMIVIATLKSTLAPTLDLIRRKAAGDIIIQSAVIDQAGVLLNTGQFEAYKALLRKELSQFAHENDTVVLAQASMAQGLEGIDASQLGKFLTSPDSGLSALVNILEQKEQETHEA